MSYKIEEVKKLPGSEVEITGEVEAGHFESFKEMAVKNLSQSIHVDGFRPGNVPEKILIEKVGEHVLLEEMAELALSSVYPKILEEQKIDAISRPQVSITKIAKGNPLGFKIKTAVMPELELPDYKSAAKEIMSKEDDLLVKDEEIENTIKYLQQSKAKKNEKGEDVLPELNDEFAQSFGPDFKTMSDLRKTMLENLTEEKKVQARQKKRAEAVEKISEKMKGEIPQVMIDSEKLSMMEEMKNNIAQMGLKWEDYIKQMKKTEQEILDGWQENALKRVKFGLVLHKIADAEKIDVPEEELKEEVEHMLSHYGKESGVTEERLKNYAYGVLRNKKVFELLENCRG